MSNITELHNFKTVITAAFLLAVNAGYIASLSLAGLHSATVAHVTGDVARSGIYIIRAEFFLFARMSVVWLAFIIGSTISAMIVSGTKTFDLRRTYGWALMLESLFLLISYLVSNRKAAVTGWWYSEYFGALACGMQNALCSSYSGNVIRTTHMTGCCTDIGIACGHEIRIRYFLPVRAWIRAKIVDWRFAQYLHLETESEESQTSPALVVSKEPSILWRLKVLLPMLFGFLLGAMIGGAMFTAYGNISLLVPALFTGLLGFIYLIWTTILMVRDKLKATIPIQMVETSMIQMTNSLRNGFGLASPPNA